MSTLTILGMSKISSKYQVTIPQYAREIFEIKSGQRIMFILEKTDKEKKLILRVS